MLTRRSFLEGASAGLVLPAWPAIAGERAYPSRPVRIIVGFAAGGAGDITARLLAQWLSDRLGRPFIVENRPGAGTNIATEAVLQAAPDGHTLLYVSPASAINATLYRNLNFNFLRDIRPVAKIGHQPDVMVVNPSLPVTTVPQFIAYAKANPGKINYGSSGNGNTPHLAAELFKMMTGVAMEHVAYRGEAPALLDLISGRVQVMFSTMPSSIGYIQDGRLRPLAVTTASRAKSLPDLPTVGDFLPGYEVSGWQGIGIPAKTPDEIVVLLNKEINAGLMDGKVKGQLMELGNIVEPGSAPDFAEFIMIETAKWARVIKFAGIEPI